MDSETNFLNNDFTFLSLPLEWFSINDLFWHVKDILNLSLVCNDYAKYIKKKVPFILKEIIYKNTLLSKERVLLDEKNLKPLAKYTQYISKIVKTNHGIFSYYGEGIWKKYKSIFLQDPTEIKFLLQNGNKEIIITNLSPPISCNTNKYFGITSEEELIIVTNSRTHPNIYWCCAFVQPLQNGSCETIKCKKILYTNTISHDKNILYIEKPDGSLIELIISNSPFFSNISTIASTFDKDYYIPPIFANEPNFLLRINIFQTTNYDPNIVYISDSLKNFKTIYIENDFLQLTYFEANFFRELDTLKTQLFFLVSKNGAIFIQDRSKPIENKENKFFVPIIPFFKEKVISIYATTEINTKNIVFLTENGVMYHFYYFLYEKTTHFSKLSKNVISLHQVNENVLIYIKTDKSVNRLNINKIGFAHLTHLC